MTETEASEATIQLMYKSYYAEMGGAGTPPEVPSRSRRPPMTDNVTAFRRPPRAAEASRIRPATKPRLPVALIFACLVVVYVGHPLLLALSVFKRSARFSARRNIPSLGEDCPR